MPIQVARAEPRGEARPPTTKCVSVDCLSLPSRLQMKSCAQRLIFCFAHFRKVNGRPRKHNATKPNNAWWRWTRSGQRNPPVITKTADIHCDRLFKIAHFPTRPLSSETGKYPPSGAVGTPAT
jgi:hypothetical protein